MSFSFLELQTEKDYKEHFIEKYCSQEIITFDGIKVNFYPRNFEHAFYKRSKKKTTAPKDLFDSERAKRIDWIKKIIEDESIKPRVGYDNRKKTLDYNSRVSYVQNEKYVVIIRMIDETKAFFVTAYLVDNTYTSRKILEKPLWEPL